MLPNPRQQELQTVAQLIKVLLLRNVVLCALLARPGQRRGLTALGNGGARDGRVGGPRGALLEVQDGDEPHARLVQGHEEDGKCLVDVDEELARLLVKDGRVDGDVDVGAQCAVPAVDAEEEPSRVDIGGQRREAALLEGGDVAEGVREGGVGEEVFGEGVLLLLGGAGGEGCDDGADFADGMFHGGDL